MSIARSPSGPSRFSGPRYSAARACDDPGTAIGGTGKALVVGMRDAGGRMDQRERTLSVHPSSLIVHPYATRFALADGGIGEAPVKAVRLRAASAAAGSCPAASRDAPPRATA